jgi:DNA-binding NarL/FixJ family response regulator
MTEDARILVVDDHEAIRLGIRAMLALDPRWQICGEASDGNEAVQKAAKLLPDLVILDVNLPGKSGLAAAQEIRRVAPRARILIFSMHDSPTLKAEFRRVGAQAFMLKSASASDFLSMVAQVLESKSNFVHIITG